MSSDGHSQNNTLDILPKTWDRCYDDRRQSSLLSSSDKIPYFLVCSKTMPLLLQYPNVSEPSDLLQKREDNFRRFDGTVRSYWSQLSCGRRSFREMNEGMRRGRVCEGLVRQKDRRENAPFQHSLEQQTNLSVVSDHEASKE